jgi:hypothetical protein
MARSTCAGLPGHLEAAPRLSPVVAPLRRDYFERDAEVIRSFDGQSVEVQVAQGSLLPIARLMCL